MGACYYYNCHHCGFAIETEPGWKDYSFFGDWLIVKVKCKECGSIEYVSYDEDPEDGLFEAMATHVCKKCGSQGKYLIWGPDDGCLKCGKRLTKSIIPTSFTD
jgi:hypothetical protein